ncbi:MAG: hypothetical protein WAX89_06270 [Alphaproteobacteria bacterium]
MQHLALLNSIPHARELNPEAYARAGQTTLPLAASAEDEAEAAKVVGSALQQLQRHLVTPPGPQSGRMEWDWYHADYDDWDCRDMDRIEATKTWHAFRNAMVAKGYTFEDTWIDNSNGWDDRHFIITWPA